MNTFSNQRALQQMRPPERVALVPRSAFADDWTEKRHLGESTPIGIRLVSDGDYSRARGEAERVADQHGDQRLDRDGWIEAFNDALMRVIVSFGACRTEDIAIPYFVDEDHVRRVLTSDGVKFLWQEILENTIRNSPLERPLDDAGALRLAQLLSTGALRATGNAGLEVGRLLRHALVEIETLALQKR